MLKRSVIASEITNLTDARYFAARGVDYLLYDLNQINVNDVMAIMEWVEGVKSLVLFDEENIHLIEEAIMQLSPFAIGSSEVICMDKILRYANDSFVFHLFPEDGLERPKIILSHADNLDQLTFKISPSSEALAFYEINPSNESLESYLQNSEAGIILKGSFEVETGVKSYENLDNLLELLELD